jgi:hypothetical protein
MEEQFPVRSRPGVLHRSPASLLLKAGATLEKPVFSLLGFIAGFGIMMLRQIKHSLLPDL